MTVVTYSKNVFIPLTNMCRNRCSYCGFRRDPAEAWFLSPEEVFSKVLKAKKLGCLEVLITLGEYPEFHRRAKEKLEGMGFRSTAGYIEALCRCVLKLNMLPHTNAGVMEVDELRRLRRYNASMGLMLECAAELEAHRESPGKNPGLRLAFIEEAGRLKIPFTTGLLIGIGETGEQRLESLKILREIQDAYGHLQEIIIQPFQPKPGTPMQNFPPPSEEEVLEAVRWAREIFPELGIQIPPNLVSDVIPFLEAGANDLGGISPLTPDFINPEHPWPNLEHLREKLRSAGFTLRERLPIYPRFVRREEFMSDEVKEVVERLADDEGYRR
jgi:FO synthase subunit 1